MCFNDMMALGLLRGLHEAGFAVPEDISVTGFDDVAIAAYAQPPLTTLDQPKYRLGAEAVRLVLQILAAPGPAAPPAQVITLRGELVVRGSTAPPHP